MASDSRAGQVFRFGLFEADVARDLLRRKGVRVRIQDQPFRVLILLLERRGEIVTREELKQRLWPEGTFVDFDGSLNVILKKLRAVLDDDADNPVFIETVPKKGYKFIAPVTVEAIQPVPDVPVAPVPETAVEGTPESRIPARRFPPHRPDRVSGLPVGSLPSSPSFFSAPPDTAFFSFARCKPSKPPTRSSSPTSPTRPGTRSLTIP